MMLVIAAGCGSAPPRPVAHIVEPPAADPAPEASGVIHRSELDRVLERGIGAFLGRLSTEPDLRDGRFVGFRVTELHDTALFEGVDLLPGDTILEINGQGIERPEHAFTVWTALRVASELTIVVLRGEERREIRYAILD